MCLAIPARVAALDGAMATVEVAGVTKRASIHLLDGVSVGDYLIIHAGFALSKLDEAEARETLRLLEQMGELEIGALG
ncbi:MAG: HypC/HybG/HupF family hydrogenase formation chaperone [Candidatus Lambdaproteobacteria bacterium]|nr:HypC/HybG/HupF family hydrogenase formation chaperone [Candidatus Lambdaproteobacteria bacterium]